MRVIRLSLVNSKPEFIIYIAKCQFLFNALIKWRPAWFSSTWQALFAQHMLVSAEAASWRKMFTHHAAKVWLKSSNWVSKETCSKSSHCLSARELQEVEKNVWCASHTGLLHLWTGTHSSRIVPLWHHKEHDDTASKGFWSTIPSRRPDHMTASLWQTLDCVFFFFSRGPLTKGQNLPQYFFPL